MKMTKLTTAILAGSLLMAGMSASAEEAKSAFTTSGSVAMTTDYLYRGISQTSGAPALQGALTLSHESGVYATVWASSINFASGLEFDPAIGFAGKVGEVGYDVGVLQYGYPNSSALTAPGPELDFLEYYASVSFAGAKLGLAYAPDFYAETGESIYAFVDYGTEVAGFGLVAHVGMNLLDDQYYGAAPLALGEDSYIDYKVGVNKAVQGVTLELAYMGSDLDDTLVPDGEGTFVATVSKAF
ncbi:MAG: hypothetical protein K0Q68_1514 [Moraxellaceae bacterium]|jgi:uncharacterized protein (TIGR02001 family)|nr:hypothetical protein [Moraxellaceae bacterium]